MFFLLLKELAGARVALAQARSRTDEFREKTKDMVGVQCSIHCVLYMVGAGLLTYSADVDLVVMLVVTAVAAAQVIAVIRTSSPFTPAAAKAPKKMGDVPMEPGIKRKSSSAPPSQMGEGSEPGKMPFTKT